MPDDAPTAEEIAEKSTNLKYFLLFTHFFSFMGLALVTMPFSNELIIITSRVFSVLSMAMLVCSSTLVSYEIFVNI